MPSSSKPLASRYSHLGDALAFLHRFAPSPQKDQSLTAHPIACYEANQERQVPTLGIAAQLPQVGRRTVLNWLTIQFAYTAEQFGTKDQLTTAQLTQAAQDFLELNPDLNPYEVMLYLRLLRAGHYGKVAYGQLTPNDLMSHTATFRAQRDKQLAQHYEQQQERQRLKTQERMRTHAITYEQYQALKAQAQRGDARAQTLLREPAP